MDQGKKYYEAYDERYRQVHSESLQWFSDAPSKIVEQTIRKYKLGKNAQMLEIGCGEGRDAVHLLKNGYRLLATDISPAAVAHCRARYSEWANSFYLLDCLSQQLPDQYDFIYAVSVLHMLVLDEDRSRFYEFIYRQLSDDGVALICTMGDGSEEWQTDITHAFDTQKRKHEITGKELMLTATSCRVVNFQTLEKEINDHHLTLVDRGITSIIPDFPTIMYAVVRKAEN